eukprot:m.101652 g.101652  ORF g.101652 m.101652 type:complete len:651 (-) comp12581_c0_seq1:154-2106(-)
MGANASSAVSNAEHTDELRHVLRFLSWEDRLSVFSVNKAHRSVYNSMENWIWMCELLREDYFLYVTREEGESWFDAFLRNFDKKDRWTGGGMQEEFSMRVCARFRPLSYSTQPNGDDRSIENGEEDDDDEQEEELEENREENGAVREGRERDSTKKTISVETRDSTRTLIPFHQRIKMIQAFFGCSSSEAKRRLWHGDNAVDMKEFDPWKDAFVGGKQLEAHPQDASSLQNKDHNEDIVNDPDKDNASDHQLPSTVKMGVLAVRPESHELVMCASGGVKRFVFDSVMPDSTAQHHAYTETSERAVSQFLNGLNACLIAYGQTGSGKTYTMFGPTESASTSISKLEMEAGIAPRVLRQVAVEVNKWQRQGMEATLKLSCVEIFGQEVTDLLHDQNTVGTWHGVAARMVLNMECAEEIKDWRETEGMLIRVERSKRRERTEMNERSSRAHTVLMLQLQKKHPITGNEMTSMLCLADLGGSEQLKKSKAEGQRKQEAVQINLGLLALKRCIAARQENARSHHVPYGDSTLTSILRPALEGNSLTTVVVTGRLDSEHAFETLQTMKFGEICQGISGGIIAADVNSATEAIDAINKELEELEERIRVEERWVNKVTVREDAEGKETVITTVLEGAEELRARYEELLQTRHDLIGA